MSTNFVSMTFAGTNYIITKRVNLVVMNLVNFVIANFVIVKFRLSSLPGVFFLLLSNPPDSGIAEVGLPLVC